MNTFESNSMDENDWCALIDYSNLLDEVTTTDLCWDSEPQTQSVATALSSDTASLSHAREISERECLRKRGRSDPCTSGGSKSCRERMRREKINERFVDLSTILDPGRRVKTDKSAILGDTIKVLELLKTETQDYRETNEKLLEEIKSLKAEKNELREEKLMLKADKEKMEQQLNSLNTPLSGFMPAHPPLYQPVANKVPLLPSYGFIPMWHYLPPCARDTSEDHSLRPPAA